MGHKVGRFLELFVSNKRPNTLKGLVIVVKFLDKVGNGDTAWQIIWYIDQKMCSKTPKLKKSQVADSLN